MSITDRLQEGASIRAMVEIDVGGKEYVQIACDSDEVELSVLRWDKGTVKASTVVTMKRRQLLDALDFLGVGDGVKKL